MKKIKVLVLTAGGAPAIGIIKYLKNQKAIPVHIIAADSNPLAAGFFFADEKLIIPPFKDSRFIEFLLSFCIKEDIKFLYPPSLVKNEGIELLSENFNLFLEKGIRIFIINRESLKKITDKREMLNTCYKNGILTPRTFLNLNDITSKDYPIFVKPVLGGGTKNTAIIQSLSELKSYQKKEKNYIFQEFLQFPEYTIDFITDFDGNFISAVPRLRQVVKNGQSIQGKTIIDQALLTYTKHICEIFKIDGPGNIQVFKDEGSKKVYLIEINPKFGSSSCLSFESGLNIPLLYIKFALGLKIDKKELIYRELTMVRYLNEIYFQN